MGHTYALRSRDQGWATRPQQSLVSWLMHLSIYVFGLEDFESRELVEWLSASDDVDELAVTLSSERMRPGDIYASAEFTHLSVALVGVAVAGVLKGASSEAGKDLYLLSKDRICRRLKKWAAARNAESKRERIRFTLTETGEMVISMRAADCEEQDHEE